MVKEGLCTEVYLNIDLCKAKEDIWSKRFQVGERATTECDADAHVVCSWNSGDLACL